MDGLAPTTESFRAFDQAGPGPEVLGALDLGTNNCRLLVARRRGQGFRVIDAFSRIVRLGEGLSGSGRLSDAAMDRTIDALKVCASKMRRRGVSRARTVATEACRRARNCAEFVGRVERETGIELEIISAGEEALLAFNGCAPLLDPAVPHALVFDIGGGSTELGWLEVGVDGGPTLRAWLSMPFGVVSLTERYGGETVAAEDYESMVADVTAILAPFEAAHDIATAVAAGRVQMLGTSGTVTTLAGCHLELPRYDRARVDGCFLDFGVVRAVSETLAAQSWAERAAHPCIGNERADLVVAGCAILEAVCRMWPVGRLRVADRGVREGILLGLIAAEAARRHAAPLVP